MYIYYRDFTGTGNEFYLEGENTNCEEKQNYYLICKLKKPIAIAWVDIGISIKPNIHVCMYASAFP